MTRLLHLKTRRDDALAERLIALQAEEPDHHSIVLDLTLPDPNYDAVLEEVWMADSVQVW